MKDLGSARKILSVVIKRNIPEYKLIITRGIFKQGGNQVWDEGK